MFKCHKFINSHCLYLNYYMKKYHFTIDLIWNWNEKKFLIDQIFKIQRIMSAETFRSDFIIHVNQNESWEFINLLTCISAKNDCLLLALTYKDEHLQNLWLKNLHEEKENFFISSSKKWSNDMLNYSWLMKMFNRCTKNLITLHQRKRLLIVDDHSSHVNMKFLDKCD